MPAVLDIVAALRDAAETGGRSDRRIAATVLEDPDFVTHASIDQVAARAGVSEPTVTRFCRSVGCAGMRDFKVRLAQALAVSDCVGGHVLIPRRARPPLRVRRLPVPKSGL